MTDGSFPPNLHGLTELSRRDGIDIRPTLLRVMTDLYVQKTEHSEQEERQFTELALRLFDLVDPATRATVAAKLAEYPAVPAAVRHRLLRDMIRLRPGATAGDRPLAGYSSAAAELSALFLAASAEERRLILLNLPYASLSPAAPIPAPLARESCHRLEAAALNHNTELFAREIERTLLIPRAHARRLIADESGEPIVVIAAALDMKAAVLQRILLCLNPTIGQSVQRVYELALLHEEVARDAALRMIAIWQANPAVEERVPVQKPAGHRGEPRQEEKSARSTFAARPKIPWHEHARTRKSETG